MGLVLSLLLATGVFIQVFEEEQDEGRGKSVMGQYYEISRDRYLKHVYNLRRFLARGGRIKNVDGRYYESGINYWVQDE